MKPDPLDIFAYCSFRDVGDDDYVAARMAFRAALASQSLWASQQAAEKYLKCILLLNRIPASDVGHDLGKAINRVNRSGKLTLDLTDGTRDFIGKLDSYGRFRYLEISNVAFGRELVVLDKMVWELRRYCTLDTQHHRTTIRKGSAAPRVLLHGGRLEQIIANKKDPARQALLWQNGFFGNSMRKKVRIPSWFRAHNSPLFLNPDILREIEKYVYLPRSVKEAYRRASGDDA